MTRRALPIGVFFQIAVLCLAVGLPLGATSALEATPGLVTKEEVLKSLETNNPAWKEKISRTSPRLFFSGKEWPQVQKEIEAMPYPRSESVKNLYEDLEKLLKDPLPVYLPPEQMVGKRGDTPTLYGALEELWQRELGDQIFSLSVAARLKPDPRYRAKLHDLVMTVIRFETWGRSKSPPMESNSDLAAGHVGCGIAVAYDWHKDLFTEDERKQICKAVAERMPNLLGGLYGNAFWARGYEENHNQVSVAALGFCGIAFYNEIPQAPEWLAAARLNFMKVGAASAADGSSVEGVSYWGYGISYILYYIEATRPIIDSADLYKTPFLKNAAAFRLMAATPGLMGNLPWGDAVTKDWSPPHHIIYKLAAEYKDSDAAWFADHIPRRQTGALNVLWARNAPAAGAGPQNLDGRLFVNDLAASRTGWEKEDYFLTIKAGFTNRNHSHLDSGALAISFGDEWVLAASGYGKGSGEGPFWQRGGTRWDYFSNATESHSTLLVNGKNQRFDVNARSTITHFFSSPEWNWTSVDLTGAYQDIKTMSRDVLHRRGDYILVFDAVNAGQSVAVEWLAQVRKEPGQGKDGTLTARGTNGRIQMKMLAPDASFSLRQPTSPKVDMKSPQFTYAVKESGTNVRFVALLQPITAAASAKQPLQSKVETLGPGVRRLEITGEGWTDRIIFSEKTGELDLVIPNETARASGRLAVVRTGVAGMTSILGIEVTALQYAGFSYRGDSPCDIAVEKSREGGWIVTSSRDVQKQVTVPKGQDIRFISKVP